MAVEPGGSENIRVVVRVRPLNPQEAARTKLKCTQVPDSRTVQISSQGFRNQVGNEATKTFSFNACVDETVDQAVFHNVCGIKGLLQSALNGYAACVFAYGQTG